MHVDGPRTHSAPSSPAAEHLAVVAAQLEVVARHRPPGRAVRDVARAVAEEDVQHLRRADAVEDLGAGALLPALADVLRQRLAGRGRDAQRRQRVARPAPDRRAAARTASARRRRSSGGAAASRAAPSPAPADPRTARRSRPPRAGTSARCRGRTRRTASPPSTRCRRADAEDRQRVQRRGPDQRAVQVHRALRLAGRARRVQPERDVVRRGLGRVRDRLGLLDEHAPRRRIARRADRPRPRCRGTPRSRASSLSYSAALAITARARESRSM